VKLPRNLDASRLIKALSCLDYQVTHQRGSHIKLTTQRAGVHVVVIPNHSPLKTGTLNAILRSVADHHGITRDELLESLKL